MTLFGMWDYTFSDRCTFKCKFNNFLLKQEVEISHTTPYNPQGNKWCNEIIWRTIHLAPKTMLYIFFSGRKCYQQLFIQEDLDCTQLPIVFHMNGVSYICIDCLQASYCPLELYSEVLYKWSNKCNILRMSVLDEVELLQANLEYVHVKFLSGRTNTVSLKHLAPKLMTKNFMKMPMIPSHRRAEFQEHRDGGLYNPGYTCPR